MYCISRKKNAYTTNEQWSIPCFFNANPYKWIKNFLHPSIGIKFSLITYCSHIAMGLLLLQHIAQMYNSFSIWSMTFQYYLIIIIVATIWRFFLFIPNRTSKKIIPIINEKHKTWKQRDQVQMQIKRTREAKLTFSVRQLGSQLWLINLPKFPLAHASITWYKKKKSSYSKAIQIELQKRSNKRVFDKIIHISQVYLIAI